MNLSKKPLAMAYVPWQTFENVMEGECALRHGTIFEDLVFPFVGAQAACQADRPVKTTPIPVLVAAITDSPICKTTPVEGEVFIDESKQTFKASENDRCT